jgi:hypothetical protein
LTIRYVSGSLVEFFINNALVASNTTNINPTATVTLGVRSDNTSASSRVFHLDRIRMFVNDVMMTG